MVVIGCPWEVHLLAQSVGFDSGNDSFGVLGRRFQFLGYLNLVKMDLKI